jgi:hypothetical protein
MKEAKIEKVQQLVAETESRIYGTTSSPDDVMIVWFCKTVQNFKALAITSKFKEFYEVTYNGDAKEFYVDVYKKTNKFTYKEESK